MNTPGQVSTKASTDKRTKELSPYINTHHLHAPGCMTDGLWEDVCVKTCLFQWRSSIVASTRGT